jgi:hypothetical protein
VTLMALHVMLPDAIHIDDHRLPDAVRHRIPAVPRTPVPLAVALDRADHNHRARAELSRNADSWSRHADGDAHVLRVGFSEGGRCEGQ